MKVAETLVPTEPRICAALLNTGSGGPRIIPQNALEDTGVYGLPDAVLVPSIGVSGGQWVPSGDKKPNAGQLVQTADGLRLVVVTPLPGALEAPVWVRSIWPLAKCSATDPCHPITNLLGGG